VSNIPTAVRNAIFFMQLEGISIWRVRILPRCPLRVFLAQLGVALETRGLGRSQFAFSPVLRYDEIWRR
jgi:hypothetical protein